MTDQNLAVLLREREAENDYLRARCYTLGCAIDNLSAQLIELQAAQVTGASPVTDQLET